MKRVEYKMFDIPATDLEGALNVEGRSGWRAAHPIGTPTGMKFLMERVLDESVTTEDLEASRKAAHESELMAKFGPGGSLPLPPSPGPGIGPRLVK
jgi:hypothetical protein